MLPYTADDGLQIIAREFGFVADSPKESEADLARSLRTFWDRMLRSFFLLKVA